jgi:hypothetical protein
MYTLHLRQSGVDADLRRVEGYLGDGADAAHVDALAFIVGLNFEFQ